MPLPDGQMPQPTPRLAGLPAYACPMPDSASLLAPYDAVLLVSFGGPEAPEEVVPFLRRVTAGRDIPDARLEEVGEHYFARGGRSPINDLNRDLLARLRAAVERGLQNLAMQDAATKKKGGKR